MTEEQQFCTFLVDEQLFGIEVERVQEIIRHQTVTRVPLAPTEIAGLMNLRGQIVPIIELRACLQVGPRESGDSTNVVLRTEDGSVSLAVDEIGDVLQVAEDAFEPPPENLRASTRRLVRGVYKLPVGLLLVLSTEVAIASATSSIDGGRDEGRR